MKEIIIATILRPKGKTGVNRHIDMVFKSMSEMGVAVRVLTPYSYHRSLVYPLFAARFFASRINKSAGVWWYRRFHELMLKLVLKKELSHGVPCVIYAQCPLSLRAAISARLSPDQKVKMAVHFNYSQADEWVAQERISESGKLFAAIRQCESHILPLADGLVFVSDYMRRELSRRIPRLREVQSVVIPNFIFSPSVV